MILVIKIIKLYHSRSCNNRMFFYIVLLRYKHFHYILFISMTFLDLEISFKMHSFIHVFQASENTSS